MKERKRYRVIDKHSGPIPPFTREYTIDDFPFLKECFSTDGCWKTWLRNLMYEGARNDIIIFTLT